jgi:proteasome accessory factor B
VTAKVERLVNLTVALLEARRPMTFAELKQRTHFYDHADPESGRRMFERDKDDLRRLGVPVEVRDLTFGEDVGYVVDRGDYELPDVDLTAEEVAALALAIQATGSAGTHLPLAKLAARAPDPAEVAAVPTRVTVEPDPVDALAEAVVQRTPLSFTYRTAGGATARRTVDPYAVVQRRSAWYLVAHDHDRAAQRAFRLDRIVDRPRTVGEPGAFPPPEDLDVAAAVAGPDAEPVVVELAVDPDARWAVEVRGATDTGRSHEGRPVLRLEALDPQRDLSWLLGFGADVEVLSPVELRRAVVAALDDVTATIGGSG